MLSLSLRLCSLPLSRPCNLLPGMIRHVKRTLVDKPFAVGWPGVGDRKHQSSDEVAVSDGTETWTVDHKCYPHPQWDKMDSSCQLEGNALSGPK